MPRAGVAELSAEWEDFVKDKVPPAPTFELEFPNTCCCYRYGQDNCKTRLSLAQMHRHEVCTDLVRRLVHFPVPVQDGLADLPLFSLLLEGPAGTDTDSEFIVLLTAANLKTSLPVFVACDCDDEVLRPGSIVHRGLVVAPSGFLMQLVNTPGKISVTLVTYKWIVRGRMEVLGQEDISDELKTLFSKVQTTPKDKDLVMDVLKPRRPYVKRAGPKAKAKKVKEVTPVFGDWSG